MDKQDSSTPHLGATRSTAGANSWTPNFDFGITFKSKKTIISSSINQLNNATAKPLTQTIDFKNFWTFLLTHEIQLRESLNLTLYGYTRLISSLNNLYSFKGEVTFQENYAVGLGYGTQGLISSLALKSIEVLEQKLSVVIAYQHPLNTALNNSFQPFQLHFQYHLSN